MLQNMLNPEPTSTGIRSGNRVIGYSAAIRLLDNGRYDKHLAMEWKFWPASWKR